MCLQDAVLITAIRPGYEIAQQTWKESISKLHSSSRSGHFRFGLFPAFFSMEISIPCANWVAQDKT
jgi:hypothetical protein